MGTTATKIVVINGSPRAASRTGFLLNRLSHAVATRLPANVHQVNFSEVGTTLLSSLWRPGLPAEGEAILREIENADLLILGTPIYRASYTGAVKHLFDLVERDALVGKVVLLAATGGVPLHGLVGEHQLRPLFGFFRTITVPTFVFANETEIDATNADLALVERIERAADEAAALLGASLNLLADRTAPVAVSA